MFMAVVAADPYPVLAGELAGLLVVADEGVSVVDTGLPRRAGKLSATPGKTV